ncbi:E3 ubiquitin-protein ligase RKP isoform X2 [Trifolium pratense]|uniref:E3 ubiquitin-protein ligase RKP isoform X2 n=1 Tax=Trifolium pratense TaxID=57577 RepID=UPI001E692F4A|nr:E3 ubiquitin-protein ligase RKP isoform X2 [Trifolium pratense]
MAEDSPRLGGFSAGLAVILNDEDSKKNLPKTRLLSCCDDLGEQSVERTLEYVFGLPNRSLSSLDGPVDSSFIRSVIRNLFSRYNANSGDSSSEKDMICRPDVVGLEEYTICGDIKIVKPPFLIESLEMFSSVRANTCVWKGKWMYEVMLETSGIQQIGWATNSCPFTDHKGVGDDEDSYAYDGRRVSKWNNDAETYGQSWVVGDVIGCCIDLERDEIVFYRNGISLGVAFQGVRKMGPGFGYHPAISLSQGERCELNFGARPFKYPIEGYHPLQTPPSKSYFVTRLLQCWSRLLDMHSVERAEHSLAQKLRRAKRFVSLEEIFRPVSYAICEELFCILEDDVGHAEYMVWGPLLSFMFEVFELHAPHDYSSLDKVVEVLLQFQGSHVLFENIINALSCGCKVAQLVLTECPYSGSYSYLALACHLLRREELMVLWWKSPDFDFLFEGFMSQKTPNKQDLESMIPTVWWPGSCEDTCCESNMMLATTALSESISKSSYYMTHQVQSISMLEEVDKQIKERACGEKLKHLKETRNEYREEVIDCVRHCAWYRISLLSRWKQRGMYAMCMWVVQLLLVLSNMDSVFIYTPEYYLEALVDCFHVLRKSDPPFVPSTILIKRGLVSFVTFVVTHFNDPRISSADLRDLLLQSISVLVQYKEYLAIFESNEAANQRLPKALLSAFDNRSWIPVTNILLRLCKGSGFSFSKNGESSSSSILFQRLLKEACINDEALFSSFLNRLFNTLSWAMTEFSVSVREMQEKYQVMEFQQRKCGVIFDLSCNLARILEFCTHEIPQAFLSGPETNLRRLTELIVFILNHTTSSADAEFFDLSLRRHNQSSEKVNRGMILAPLVGIMLNLLDATKLVEYQENNDLVDVFLSMNCAETVLYGFQYLVDYNWDGSCRGEAYMGKYKELENFLTFLACRTMSEHDEVESVVDTTDLDDNLCCICYACEADAQIAPCLHRSCYGCVSRHLLNCQRCFFCNATVTNVSRINEKTG